MKKWVLPSLLLASTAAMGQIGVTDRISIGWPLPPNAETNRIEVSQTGQYVVYESTADNIVGGDLNGARDIFMYTLFSGETEIVSVTGAGISANGDSFRADVSSHGRFVVFQSAATNLVPGDTNGVSDIFVRDRQTQTTFRVSVSTAGVQGNGASTSPVISDSGLYVAYISTATNLVAGDTNGEEDVFLYDLQTGVTTRVSVSNGGAQANGGTTDVAINSQGNRIAFSSTATNLVTGDTNGVRDVFLRDTQASTTVLLSRSTAGVIANGASRSPSVNASGDKVAFRSTATNLVTGDTNGVDDIFVRNIAASSTLRASVSATGVQGNAQSAVASIHPSSDLVAFSSTATNLVTGDTNGVSDVFYKNFTTGLISRSSVSNAHVQGNGASGSPAVSGGNFVVFLSDATNLVDGDTNGVGDGFGRLSDSITLRVTSTGLDGDGGSLSASISDNGRYVVFNSNATNLVEGDTNGERDIFRLDLFSLNMVRVSVSNGGGQSNNSSFYSSISADGRYIAFQSFASNLVSGDTNGFDDIFVRDVVEGTTKRVSVSSGGAQGNNGSGPPAISANGRYVTFGSDATNLVVGDTNGLPDVFVHDIQTAQTRRASVNSAGQQGNGFSSEPAISDDGNLIAFTSYSTNLVIPDTNASGDIFVKDMTTGTIELVSISSAGIQGNGISLVSDISGNGSRVAFTSGATNFVTGDTNGVNDVFVRDRTAGTTVRASVTNSGAQSNGSSDRASISSDGLSVGFESIATNLVIGDTNGLYDCFVRSLARNTTRRVSVSSSGVQGNSSSFRTSISSDGLAAVFESDAPNLVLHDRNGEDDVFLNDSRIKVESLTLVRGVGESGGFNSLLYPDDIQYILRPGVTFTTSQAPIELVGEATSSVQNPTSLEFAIEFNSTAPAIRQTIEMYNFVTSAYELVDTRQSTLADSVVVVAITSNAGRFVDSNGKMRTRLAYKANGPVFVYPWRTRIDHIRWTVF